MPASQSAARKIPTEKLATLIREQWRVEVSETYLPRVCDALKMLPEQEIWWRPNPASNSMGNLVLHLVGNVRQWIVSGLGGAPDTRERDREFSEKGPLPSKDLIRTLQSTTNEAARVVAQLSPAALTRHYDIQGFQVTGYEAANHVAVHFALHAGQIIYVAKMKSAKDLGFTHLPPVPAPAKSRAPAKR